MTEPIILVGGGDHCMSAIDVIEQEGKFSIEGILDVKEKVGEKILGYKIIGTDDDINKLRKKYKFFLVTVGHVRNAQTRIKIYTLLKSLGATLPTIISPLAYVSKHSTIGEGTILFPFSIVDVDSVVGNNCIINHATTIGHGAILEDHCHISANCVLGKCVVGSGTFIGINCWVNNGISIANNSIIGSCSNVLKTIKETGVYAGNPATKLNK